MTDITIFYCAKVFHIAALIFWLGPSLGAWLLLRVVRKQYADDHELSVMCHRVFTNVLLIEHIAFVVLLVSGAVMAMKFQFYQQGWLQWKLALVLIIILPLELFDVWLGNVKLHKLFRQAEMLDDEASKRILSAYHITLTRTAIFILPITMLVIFCLVIAKPHMPSLYF